MVKSISYLLTQSKAIVECVSVSSLSLVEITIMLEHTKNRFSYQIYSNRILFVSASCHRFGTLGAHKQQYNYSLACMISTTSESLPTVLLAVHLYIPYWEPEIPIRAKVSLLLRNIPGPCCCPIRSHMKVIGSSPLASHISMILVPITSGAGWTIITSGSTAE